MRDRLVTKTEFDLLAQRKSNSRRIDALDDWKNYRMGR